MARTPAHFTHASRSFTKTSSIGTFGCVPLREQKSCTCRCCLRRQSPWRRHSGGSVAEAAAPDAAAAAEAAAAASRCRPPGDQKLLAAGFRSRQLRVVVLVSVCGQLVASESVRAAIAAASHSCLRRLATDFQHAPQIRSILDYVLCCKMCVGVCIIIFMYRLCI